MDDTPENKLRIYKIENKIDSFDDKLKDMLQGEDYRFKSLWHSLPICLVIFGGIQYLNAKINNENIEKYVQDAKEKINNLENILNNNIKNQDSKISDLINAAVDGSLTSVNIYGIPRNDSLLRAYPTIEKKNSDDGREYFQISLVSYILLQANAGERGYLIASSYKWGGNIAEKFMIGERNAINPYYFMNEIGYLSQEEKEILITEYGYVLSYTANINRSTCYEAKKVVSELQKMKSSGWIDVTMIMKRIKNKPTSKRFEISVGEIVQDCA